MQCITWKPWILLFIQLFYFQLFLNVSVNIFRNPFFIFHLLDKQHPSWWEKFPFFKYPLSLCTPMCVWVYSWGPPFSLSCLVCSTLQRMDEALVDAWLYFPGLKVGKIYLNLPFWIVGGVDYK
jgi:hypothetical protein